MRQDWEPEDLIEVWTLLEDDMKRVRNNLATVAADGHHPELAEALSAPGRPLTPEATFTQFLNRLIDGLDTD